MTTQGNDLIVDGKVHAKQATQAGECVVLGSDGMVPSSIIPSSGGSGGYGELRLMNPVTAPPLRFTLRNNYAMPILISQVRVTSLVDPDILNYNMTVTIEAGGTGTAQVSDSWNSDPSIVTFMYSIDPDGDNIAAMSTALFKASQSP